MTEETKAPRKRRTPEELRAHYAEKLKGLEENDKREAIRLLSGAYDDVQKATTYQPAASAKADLATASQAIKGALSKLGVK